MKEKAREIKREIRHQAILYREGDAVGQFASGVMLGRKFGLGRTIELARGRGALTAEEARKLEDFRKKICEKLL